METENQVFIPNGYGYVGKNCNKAAVDYRVFCLVDLWHRTVQYVLLLNANQSMTVNPENGF